MRATLERTATLEVATDAALGVDSLCFATTDTPVLRVNKSGVKFWEHIDCAGSDYSVLNRLGLFIFEHDETKRAGEVVSGTARCDRDGKARCEIRWDREQFKVRSEIMDGKADNNFSCGYDWIAESKSETRADGLHIWFRVKFIEVSCLLISRPADRGAGLYRSSKMKTQSLEEAVALAISGARRSEGQYTREELQNEYSVLSLAQGAPDQFTQRVAASVRAIAGAPIPDTFIPWEGLLPRHRRDLTAQGGLATGGAFVPTQMGPAIEVLRPHSAPLQLGAQAFSGLKGVYQAPRITAGVTPKWKAETEAQDLEQILTDQPGALPCRLTAQLIYSEQWLRQAGPEAEDAIRYDISAGMGATLERAILLGQGANDEPLGVMNTPGVQALLFGGAATWQNITDLEGALNTANVGLDGRGFAVSPATVTKWKNILRAGNSTRYLMDDNGTVNGQPSAGTNHLSGTHQTIFGRWPDCLVLLYGDGIHFIRDAVTQAGSGKIVLTCVLYAAVLLRHPEAFIISADAANQ